MLKLLPIVVLVAILGATYFYLPLKRLVAYDLHLTSDADKSCCNVEDVLNSSGEFDQSADVAVFDNELIDYPKTSLASAINSPTGVNLSSLQNPNLDSNSESSSVLGTTNAAGEEKWIEVSLVEQRLRAWEGNKIVMEFPISSGLWGRTPKGDYRIWYKTRSQTMSGGSKELRTYYNLPNVPHNMFFYKGYAIHGAYWHNNFGNPMSHGCVNSPLQNAAEIFSWAGPIVPEGKNIVRSTPENPGTRVFVH